jgi:hypothetical protein
MSAAVQAWTARADGYARREPQAALLCPVVREHWPVFLERAEEQGGLPRFVVRDFEEYLRCGRSSTAWSTWHARAAGTRWWSASRGRTPGRISPPASDASARAPRRRTLAPGGYPLIPTPARPWKKPRAARPSRPRGASVPPR